MSSSKPHLQHFVAGELGRRTVLICIKADIKSELHRYRGHSKSNMQPGYVCGHEGVGVIHEVGSQVKKFSVGDRVIAPFLTSW
jgi:threonine dehydrogenase-like Zn-dependent dehydrogenase